MELEQRSMGPCRVEASPPWDRQVNPRWYIDLRDSIPLEEREAEVQLYLCAVGLFGKYSEDQWASLSSSALSSELDAALSIEGLKLSPLGIKLAKEGIMLLREKWAEGKGLFLPDESEEFVTENSSPWWNMLLKAKLEETNCGGELATMKEGEGDEEGIFNYQSYNEQGWVPWVWLCELKAFEAVYDVSPGPSAAYQAAAEGSLLRHPDGRCLVLTNLRPSYQFTVPINFTLDRVVTMYEISCHPAFGITSDYDTFYDDFGKDNEEFLAAWEAESAKRVAAVETEPQGNGAEDSAESQGKGGSGSSPGSSRQESEPFYTQSRS